MFSKQCMNSALLHANRSLIKYVARDHNTVLIAWLCIKIGKIVKNWLKYVQNCLLIKINRDNCPQIRFCFSNLPMCKKKPYAKYVTRKQRPQVKQDFVLVHLLTI